MDVRATLSTRLRPNGQIELIIIWPIECKNAIILQRAANCPFSTVFHLEKPPSSCQRSHADFAMSLTAIMPGWAFRSAS